MSNTFKYGDHVEWNSEAGRVRGAVVKKVVSDVKFKGYTHHATKAEPQYFIKSDKTDHVAIHKGSALRRLTIGQKEAKEIIAKTKNETLSGMFLSASLSCGPASAIPYSVVMVRGDATIRGERTSQSFSWITGSFSISRVRR
jgi:hypothetical protein